MLQLRLHATCGASPPLPERRTNDSLPSLPVGEPEPGSPDGQSLLRKILYHPPPIPQRGATEWRLLSSQGPSAHLNISLPFWAQSPRRRLNLIIRCHWDPTWRCPGRRSGSLTQRTRDSGGTLVRRRGAGGRAPRVRAYTQGFEALRRCFTGAAEQTLQGGVGKGCEHCTWPPFAAPPRKPWRQPY